MTVSYCLSAVEHDAVAKKGIKATIVSMILSLLLRFLLFAEKRIKGPIQCFVSSAASVRLYFELLLKAFNFAKPCRSSKMTNPFCKRSLYGSNRRITSFKGLLLFNPPVELVAAVLLSQTYRGNQHN